MLAGTRKARVASRLDGISGASSADHGPWGDINKIVSRKKRRRGTHMSLALADLIVGIACLRGFRGKLPCCHINVLWRGSTQPGGPLSAQPGGQPREATVAVERVVVKLQGGERTNA